MQKKREIDSLSKSHKELSQAGADDHPQGACLTPAMICITNLPPELIIQTTSLREALKVGDKAAFELGLAKILPKYIDYSDPKGQTPLISLAANGYAYGVKRLLESGAKPDLHDKDGCTALHRASAIADIAELYLLLNSHATIDTLNESTQTPLFCLVEKTTLDPSERAICAKYLLVRGAKTDIIDISGHTLLQLAAANCPEIYDYFEHPETLPKIEEIEAEFMGKVKSLDVTL